MNVMNVKIYDQQFNANEWAVILLLCAGIFTISVLPRRFSAKLSVLFFMCGVTFGFLFDHVLSVIPISFYDVNDTSRFQIIDFVSYWMYGPISYVFFYVYDALHVRVKFSPIYILVTTLISSGLERICALVGIFHYDHGYSIGISFVIYLMVHSVWVWLFYLLRRAEERT